MASANGIVRDLFETSGSIAWASAHAVRDLPASLELAHHGSKCRLSKPWLMNGAHLGPKPSLARPVAGHSSRHRVSSPGHRPFGLEAPCRPSQRDNRPGSSQQGGGGKKRPEWASPHLHPSCLEQDRRDDIGPVEGRRGLMRKRISCTSLNISASPTIAVSGMPLRRSERASIRRSGLRRREAALLRKKVAHHLYWAMIVSSHETGTLEKTRPASLNLP